MFGALPDGTRNFSSSSFAVLRLTTSSNFVGRIGTNYVPPIRRPKQEANRLHRLLAVQSQELSADSNRRNASFFATAGKAVKAVSSGRELAEGALQNERGRIPAQSVADYA